MLNGHRNITVLHILGFRNDRDVHLHANTLLCSQNRVFSLQVRPGDLELQLIFRLPKSLTLERMTVLEGERMAIYPTEVSPLPKPHPSQILFQSHGLDLGPDPLQLLFRVKPWNNLLWRWTPGSPRYTICGRTLVLTKKKKATYVISTVVLQFKWKPIKLAMQPSCGLRDPIDSSVTSKCLCGVYSVMNAGSCKRNYQRKSERENIQTPI